MTFKWIFDLAPANVTTYSDAIGKLVMPTSEMTLLEIFERENDQNLTDARFDMNKPTTSNYEHQILNGLAKNNFEAVIDLPTALTHVDAAVNPPRENMPKNERLDPSTKEPLELMKIIHNNGLGLLGQEFDSEETDDENFIGLVKSTGLTKKQTGGSGGSHGVGKNVYWQWSKYGIVLFYSSLSKDYDDEGAYCGAGTGASCAHKTRLMATCRVGVDHEVNGKRFSPNGLAGNTATKNATEVSVSLFDDDADAMATSLGLEVRTAAEPGVTIVIVGYRNPATIEEEEADDSIISRLLLSSALHWFPAAINNTLVVSSTENGTEELWDPMSKQAHLLKWLEKGLDDEKGPQIMVSDPNNQTGQITVDSRYQRIDLELEIPRDHPKNTTNNVQKSRAVLALQITETEWPTFKELPLLGQSGLGNIICIRHNGMVVTYKPFVQRPNKQYTGILLVGNSVDIFDKKLRGTLDTNYQNIGEEMLKYSEPAVHDDWNGKNFQATANSKEELKIVANSGKTKITEFITNVRNAIRIALGDIEPPKASKDANWAELSKALEFGRSNSDSGGRIIKITKTSFKRTEPDKGLLSFDLVVPDRSNKQWSRDVTQWNLKLKAKVMFADGKTKSVDLTCWEFDKLLDDANHAAMTSHVKMNYTATKAPWKRKTSQNSIALKVNEWIGERNKLTAPILLSKSLKISFKKLKIDLTGYENAHVGLVIETNEVKL